MPERLRVFLARPVAGAVWRYAGAILITVAAALLALPLHPELNTWSVVFIAAVACAAALGGVGPGLCATVTAVLLVDFLFLEPPRTLRIVLAADAIGLAVLGAVAAVVAGVTGSLRSRKRAAQDKALEAAGIASLLERRLQDQERDAEARRTLAQPDSARFN
ncbi:MAG TPA: DUF4118 domain-containing protein [Gemmatimonadales bacterium]|nr:DUF4118 domain-containing protein [Gemmatimonadales bacterium]